MYREKRAILAALHFVGVFFNSLLKLFTKLNVKNPTVALVSLEEATCDPACTVKRQIVTGGGSQENVVTLGQTDDTPKLFISASTPIEDVLVTSNTVALESSSS